MFHQVSDEIASNSLPTEPNDDKFKYMKPEYVCKVTLVYILKFL